MHTHLLQNLLSAENKRRGNSPSLFRAKKWFVFGETLAEQHNITCAAVVHMVIDQVLAAHSAWM